MKKNNKKGFTLAELLIVVAIIAVLVAVAIPVFTQQLHRSQDAADLSNIRAYYAELQSQALANGNTTGISAVTGQNKIKLQTGEEITLKNLTYDVEVGDYSVKVTWECGSHIGSGESSGSFGGTEAGGASSGT